MSGRRLVRLLVLAAASGCGDAADPVAVSPPKPVRIEFTSQPAEVTAGASLPVIRITVLDRAGRRVPGATLPITLRLVGGPAGAALHGTITRSASDGRVTFDDLRIERAGEGYRLVASATGLSPDTSVVLDVVAAAPASVRRISDDGLMGVAGLALADPVRVAVEDRFGNPVRDVEVRWQIVAGGGSVDRSRSRTDDLGTADTRWTLGAQAGLANNVLQATVAGVGSAMFTASGGADVPARLLVLAGDAQLGVVGEAVAVPPAVRLTDAGGNGVAGVSIAFRVTAGGGSILGGPALTDGDGVARLAQWTLGPAAGTGNNVLEASAPGVGAVGFTASAGAAGGAALTIAAGDGQTAEAGAPVSTPPAVRVTDRFGNLVGGVAVTFRVTAGGGSVTGAMPLSGPDGLAALGGWTVGRVAGQANNAVQAVVDGVGSVTFTASVLHAAPTSVTIASGDGQAGTVGAAVPAPPSVRVADGFGNVVPGVSVVFTVTAGGGSAAGSPAVTGQAGTGTLGSWTLGTVAGAPNTLAAVVAGVDSVTFTATAAPGPPRGLAIEGGDDQTAPIGTAVPVPPSVRVRDQFDNATPGASVTFAVIRGGGSIVGSPAITDATGVATVGGWTLASAGPASDGLEATVPGGGAVTFTASGVATLVDVSGGGVNGAGAVTHDCAITADGDAVCWGDNGDGQLGNGTREASAVPALVRGGLRFAAVTAGGRHSCALDPGDTAYCWGRNAEGQLGDGTTVGREAPVPVAGGLSFIRLAAGLAHTCGVTAGGDVFCWGRNLSGQVGDSTADQRTTPVRARADGVTFASVTTGSAHTCAVATGGAAYCWGRNFGGTLGDGTETNRHAPVPVLGDLTFVMVGAGRTHTCGVTTGLAAYCWGENDDGELGNGGNTTHLVPALVADGAAYASVSAGGGGESLPGSDDYTCGLTTGGDVRCWGSNDSGQLGTGGGGGSSVPVAVSGGIPFAAVSAGSDHACGVSAFGIVHCWGGTWDSSPTRVPGQP